MYAIFTSTSFRLVYKVHVIIKHNYYINKNTNTIYTA